MYAALGKTEAETVFREALDVRRELYGPEHLKVAQTLNNLGVIAFKRGQMPEAERYYREAVAIARRVAASPFEVARLQISLAAALAKQEKSTEAIAELRDSTETLRRTSGVENTFTLMAMGNLARNLFFAGEYQEAEALQQEVLRARQKLLSPDHDDVAGASFSLGETLTIAGRLTEAELLLRQSLATYMKHRIPQSAEDAWRLNGLAWNLSEQGRHEEAVPLYREAYEVLVKIDPVPADRAVPLDGIGEALFAQGQIAQAEEVLRQSLAVRRDAKASAADLAASQTSLGRILCAREKVEEGSSLAESGLKVRRADLRPGHRLLGHSELAFGQCLAAQQRLKEAETMLAAAYTTLVGEKGVTNRYAREAAATLVALYEKGGNVEKAAAWRAKGPVASQR